MKYIVVKRQSVETAILCIDLVTHSNAINPRECPPISAGFWHLEDGQVVVEADRISDSLGLRPRPQDASIIRTTLFMMGLIEDASTEDIALACGFPTEVLASAFDKWQHS